VIRRLYHAIRYWLFGCPGRNPVCPCQDGDACHYRDAADGTKAWPLPQ